MELGFDQQDLLDSLRVRATGDGLECGLDWSGLKARFEAAHALRRELLLAALDRSAGGSFAIAGALVLDDGRQGIRAVNPNGLAKGKGLAGTRMDLNGDHDAGERGQI